MKRRTLAAMALLGVACARTGAWPSSSGGEGGALGELADECAVDTDCASDDACLRPVCVTTSGARPRQVCRTEVVNCADADACTIDRCVPGMGCTHEPPADADHDGFVARAPDGVPASCGGQDCDDTNAAVHPGAPELCDSLDNDCDGDIDTGAVYSPGTSVRIEPTLARTTVVGLAFGEDRFGLTFGYEAEGHKRSAFELLDAEGVVASGPEDVSAINADTFAGSLAFSGRSFLTTWADARQAGNYEVYATRFDRTARKLQPDLRVTDASGFSLRPSVRFTGSEYAVVWPDHRYESRGGGSVVLAHRLSEGGELAGQEVQLSQPDEDADFPDFDVTRHRLGLAYVVPGAVTPTGESTTRLLFRTFDLAFGDATAPVELGTDAQEPTVVSAGDRFFVAWHTGSLQTNWGPVLQGMLLDERGTPLRAGPITSGDAHAKQRALLSLGERALVVWSATPAEGSAFELFYEFLELRTLGVMGSRQGLAASAEADMVDPLVVLGEGGTIGVTYRAAGPDAAYFTPLRCVAVIPPPAPH